MLFRHDRLPKFNSSKLNLKKQKMKTKNKLWLIFLVDVFSFFFFFFKMVFFCFVLIVQSCSENTTLFCNLIAGLLPRC